MLVTLVVQTYGSSGAAKEMAFERKLGRARETTAGLFRPKTVDTAAVERGAEETRGTTSTGVKSNLNASRRVFDGSERGHSPIVVGDAAAASGGAG